MMMMMKKKKKKKKKKKMMMMMLVVVVVVVKMIMMMTYKKLCSPKIKCRKFNCFSYNDWGMKHQSLQDELLKLAESQAKSFLPKDAKDDVYFLPHKPWEFGQAKGIKEHHEPHGPMERAAFQTAQFLRGLLDNIAGYEPVPVHAGKKIQKDVAQEIYPP
nr:hypothetical protein BaRGS_011777 [Batillaria attramentaria]